MATNKSVIEDDFLTKTIFKKCKSNIASDNISEDTLNKIISVAINETEEFSRPMWRFCKELYERNKDIFKIITPEILLNVIRHLKRIANQKIECRAVGVKIIIFSQEVRAKNFGSYPLQFQPYVSPSKIKNIRGFFIDNSNNLQRIYKCIDSDKAFFAYVYDKQHNKLEFKEIKASVEGMTEICGDSTIGFELLSGVPCIRIFNNKEKIADYYLSETTGDWRARFDCDIFNILMKFNMFSENDAHLLTNIATQISVMGYGTILVITNKPERIENDNMPCKINSEKLDEAQKNKTIYNYTSYDGAVIIKCGKKNNINDKLEISNFGVILNSEVQINKNDNYDILLKYTNSGSRHEKAVGYAYSHKKDCVIVISENRTISIIRGIKPIYWRDNPNPQKLIKYVKKECKNDSFKRG